MEEFFQFFWIDVSVGVKISLYEAMPVSVHLILCFVFSTFGATIFFSSEFPISEKGRRKEEKMMSCFESTFEFNFEHMTSVTFS